VYEIYGSGLFRKFFQRDLTALLLIGCTLLCMHIGMNDGFYIILFAGLVYTFACNNGRLHIICNNRLAQYLGKISYSIYMTGVFIVLPFLTGLIKLPGVQYAVKGPPTAGILLGAGYTLFFLLVQIGISTLTYYGVEKPCRKYINAKLGKETMPVYA
jgi:peptidoglycan/LPS O-acetylase OafA/YrhL